MLRIENKDFYEGWCVVKNLQILIIKLNALLSSCLKIES